MPSSGFYITRFRSIICGIASNLHFQGEHGLMLLSGNAPVWISTQPLIRQAFTHVDFWQRDVADWQHGLPWSRA